MYFVKKSVRSFRTEGIPCSRGRPPRTMQRARRPQALLNGSAFFAADFADGADDPANLVP
jgi:hypothetical protein